MAQTFYEKLLMALPRPVLNALARQHTNVQSPEHASKSYLIAALMTKENDDACRKLLAAYVTTLLTIK